MSNGNRDQIFAAAGRLGALALHAGTTLEQRRARTAAAREASIASRAAAKRQTRKPTMTERIAAAEAALPSMDPIERARQTAWIAEARQTILELDELRRERESERFNDLARLHRESS